MNQHDETIDEAFRTLDALAAEVSHVVSRPGVYIMRDEGGKILYVGKALNLKKRLQSYFQRQRPQDPKTRLLISKVARFETIITHTEKEALILESNLIKRHRPRFNVVLKDDKRYPSLRLNPNDAYPNLSIVRKRKSDGALYFGPYASAGAVRQTLKFINKTFKLCKCRCDRQKMRSRPCLNYQMGLCMGPCVKEVDPKTYREAVNEVIAFLRGRTPALVRKLKKQMLSAAEAQAFEKAAALRDKMFALEQTLERQVSVTADFRDRDVFALAVEEEIAVIAFLRVRGGFLLGGRTFVFEDTLGDAADQMGSFLSQHYQNRRVVPKEIIVSHQPAEKAFLEEQLGGQKGAKVIIMVPKRGDKGKLLQLAMQNASQAVKDHRRQKEGRTDLLQRLQACLQLDRLPGRNGAPRAYPWLFPQGDRP